MHRVELKEKSEMLMRFLFIQVPNAPCGVESFFHKLGKFHSLKFLMHRVELKDSVWNFPHQIIFRVPNAPCGVERTSKIVAFSISLVPNAPCGVESDNMLFQFFKACMFLMHRVELKARRTLWIVAGPTSVPNAPCGVESL